MKGIQTGFDGHRLGAWRNRQVPAPLGARFRNYGSRLWLAGLVLLCGRAGAEPSVTASTQTTPREGPSRHDGVYGRLRGDVDVGIGLGAELAPRGWAAAARVTVHYFGTAGVYALYGTGLYERAALADQVSVGVDLQPLFLPRWSQGWEQGPALLDLVVDSWSLALGVYWSLDGGHASSEERGLMATLGWGVPLLVQARGPWLKFLGSLQFPDNVQGPPQSCLLILLDWHEFLLSPFSNQ